LKNITYPNNDQDPALRAALYQIRCYLYGNLSELMLIKYRTGQIKNIKFNGLMSFFPLLDDVDQLKRLDGWLLSTLYRTILLRMRMLNKIGKGKTSQFPFTIKRTEMPARFRQHRDVKRRTYQIPSFLRIYNAIRHGVASQGIASILNDESQSYNYSN